MLVYSIASRATLDRLEVFHRSVQKKGDPVFMLVGNKIDKAFEREVSKDEGAALARQFGCEFIETSAKTAQNVDRAFTNLVRALRHATELKAQIPLKEKKKKCLIL
jgi:GTPase KRas protein